MRSKSKLTAPRVVAEKQIGKVLYELGGAELSGGMAASAEVIAEIKIALPCFGLRVSSTQAAHIASTYLRRRPTMTASELAGSLLDIAEFQWGPENKRSTRVLIMRSLIEHLDGLYFVPTFEHEGPSAGRR